MSEQDAANMSCVIVEALLDARDMAECPVWPARLPPERAFHSRRTHATVED